MASETPGGARHQKRRQLRWADDKSTNKVYASGSPSAITGRTVADSTLKPGQKPVANPTPTMSVNDKSADKYYAEGGSSRAGVAGVRKKGVVAKPAASRAAKPKSSWGDGAVIMAPDEVRGVMDRVPDAFAAGKEALVIYVKAGDSKLLGRTRAALELLMTGEKITEAQYHSVRLTYLKAEEQAPPVPTKTVQVEATPDDLDPLAFLNSDAEEPAVDTTAVTPAVVTEEVAAPDKLDAKAEDGLDGDDGDDDSDFLTPKAE